MAFGIKQVNHPTPQRIALLFDILASACGIISAWMATASFISHTVSDAVGSALSGLVIPLLLLFKRFYGVDIKAGITEVPIEDVKVMIDKK